MLCALICPMCNSSSVQHIKKSSVCNALHTVLRFVKIIVHPTESHSYMLSVVWPHGHSTIVYFCVYFLLSATLSCIYVYTTRLQWMCTYVHIVHSSLWWMHILSTDNVSYYLYMHTYVFLGALGSTLFQREPIQGGFWCLNIHLNLNLNLNLYLNVSLQSFQ